MQTSITSEERCVVYLHKIDKEEFKRLAKKFRKIPQHYKTENDSFYSFTVEITSNFKIKFFS